MEKSNASNNRIAKNTLFLFIRMAFILIVSLYTSRVLLRTLGVTDYGVFNVVAGFVSLFSFLNSALSSGIQRFYNYEYGKNGNIGLSKVYVCATVIQFSLIVILVILLETIGLWYIHHKLVVPIERMVVAQRLFQFSVFSLVMVVLGIPYSAAIMAHERMDYYAIVGIIDVLLKLIIVVLLPLLSVDQLIAYGFFTLCISILNFLFYFIYSKIKFKSLNLHHCPIDKDLLKAMLGFSGWHIFGTFALVAKTQGINVVLNFFFGPVVNAARGITYQIQSAIMGFIGNITTAARPQLVQSYAQDNTSRTINLMYSIGKICFYALLMIVIPVSLEIDYILDIWLGSDVVPQYTNIFTILVLMIASVDILNTPVSMVVHATGNMKKYQMITSCVSLLILPFGYISFRFGAPPIMIFVISLIMSVIVQCISLYILRGLVQFSLRDYYLKVIIPIILVVPISLALPCLIRFSFSVGVLRFASVTGLSIISVSIAAYFLGLAKKEKELVKSIYNNVYSKLKLKIHKSNGE